MCFGLLSHLSWEVAPYLLTSKTFRQLVAKGGTLGRSSVACCVFTAIIRVAATLTSSKPLGDGAALSVRSEVFFFFVFFGHVQVCKAAG